MMNRALLLPVLCLAACAPLRDHRQLAVIEARSTGEVEESAVALAPTEEGQSTSAAAPARSPHRIDDKDCLVLGRAVDLLGPLHVVDRGDGWQLTGEVRVGELDHEAYDLRIEVFAIHGALLLSIVSPLKPLGPIDDESRPFTVDLPEPRGYDSLRIGIVPEQSSRERLSLWD